MKRAPDSVSVPSPAFGRYCRKERMYLGQLNVKNLRYGCGIGFNDDNLFGQIAGKRRIETKVVIFDSVGLLNEFSGRS